MKTRLAAAAALALFAIAACAPTDEGAKLSMPVVVPDDDAQELARIYRLVEDRKFTLAEIKLRDLQRGARADITRALADIAFAEILYQRGEFDRATVLCSRHVSSPIDEVAGDAHMILGKIDLAQWNLASARNHFDDARRICSDVGLQLRVDRARQYIEFSEALILFDSGAYAEAREVLTSFTGPEFKPIVDRLYRTED